MNHYLSLILFLPLIGAFLLLLVPKQNENLIRWIANGTALAEPWRTADWFRPSW